MGESTPEINSWSRPWVDVWRWGEEGNEMKGREKEGERVEEGSRPTFLNVLTQQTPPFQQLDF